MATGLLILGAIILIGVVGNLLFSRTRIPESLFLILAGVLIGPVLGWVPQEFFRENTSFFVTIALIIVLLNSGLNLDLYRTLKNTGYALLFTVAVFLFTMGTVAFVTHHFFGWPILHGIFLGIVGSGTTTVTITHLVEKLRTDREVVDPDTKNLLVVESVVNDLTVISGASVLLAIAEPGKMTGQGIATLLFNELLVSLCLGALLGIAWVFLAVRIRGSRLSYIFTVGAALLIHVLAEYVGMNGPLTVMMFSLVLGNPEVVTDLLRVKSRAFKGLDRALLQMKKTDTEFTFLVRTFFFVLLGIIFDLGVLTNAALIALALSVLAAELAARYLGCLAMSVFHESFKKARFIRVTLVASGVTSTLVAFLAIEAGIDIPYFAEIVLMLVVLTTITAILGTSVQEYRTHKKIAQSS